MSDGNGIDVSSIPTSKLVERCSNAAKDQYQITQPLWDTLPMAWLGGGLGFAFPLIAPLMLVGAPGPIPAALTWTIYALMIVFPVVGVCCCTPWLRARRRVRDWIAETEAYTAELKRRRSAGRS